MNSLQAMDLALGDQAQNCPVGTAVAVLSGKWKLPVLRPLYLRGPLRYGELLAELETIAPKELTRNLRELEYAGLVMRTSSHNDDGHFYALSSLGTQLGTTFRALGEFGTSYLLSRQTRSSSPTASN